jgi:hypothetical protein
MATEDEFERWDAQRKGDEFPKDPEVKIKPDVKSLTEDPYSALPQLPDAEIPTVKVRVLPPYRMVCGGIFTAGDVFDAPHNDETLNSPPRCSIHARLLWQQPWRTEGGA